VPGGATPGDTGHLIARGPVVQVGQGCREVKRDGTVGLVGCWIKAPPKAALPSRRVRPPALIALDRGHGRDVGRLLVLASRPLAVDSQACRMTLAGVSRLVGDLRSLLT
jgi:hypothetical protein